MNYLLIKETIELLKTFESEYFGQYPKDINGFKKWISDKFREDRLRIEPDWEGKKNGRSPESVISTLILHMNRYAKTYSKAAIAGSEFSTQEEFIYLITLKAFGAMSKMELIKKNIQEKPAGMQIINRLIKQGWVNQKNSNVDKRSKVIAITESGINALEKQMSKIRQATKIVVGNLTHNEQMELIRILSKLDNFHNPIFTKNIDSNKLLTEVNDYIHVF